MLSLPTHIPVPSTPALPSSPLLEDCIEKGKKGIWSFGACGSWLHSLCKMTAGCIQPGRSLVCLGQVKTYYTCNTWELTGSAQRARCVLDVLQLFSCFFQNLLIQHHVCWPLGLCPHCHPETWGPYSVISFESLPANQLLSLPLATFFFPLPLRAAALFKKGLEPLGEFV